MRVLVLLILVVLVGTTNADRRQVIARAESSMVESDWQEGGSCADGDGCRREVLKARAVVSGQPLDENGCNVVERSAGDGYGVEDVTEGATLGVLHTCESDGEVLPQGTDACDYTVCASFSWNANGSFEYEVLVRHGIATGAARTVSVEVYVTYDEEGGAPVSGESSSMQCNEDDGCGDRSECGGDSTEVQVFSFDSTGDGWVDPFGNATEYWSLTGTTRSWSGTLMEGHQAARSSLCLVDGVYEFSAPGSVAWPDDISFWICETALYAGQAASISVSGEACSISGDVVQVSPLSIGAPGTGDSDSCGSCTEFTLDLAGSYIGVYDEAECGSSGDRSDYGYLGSGGGSGCTVDSYYPGAPATCRFCVTNRVLWAEANPGARDPDWPDCPCCAAEALGEVCTTVDVESPGMFEGENENDRQGWVAVVVVSITRVLLCRVDDALALEKGRVRAKKPAPGGYSGKACLDLAFSLLSKTSCL